MIETLDYRGLNCPEPVIRSKKFLEKEQPKAITILADNPASVENLTRFWEKSGYLVHSSQVGNYWEISASENVDSKTAAPGAFDAEMCPSDVSKDGVATNRKTVVLLTTDTLGRGDDELGQKLMINFLATLPELGKDLWRVILLNGGVKLAATPGPALENLQKLANDGVGILVCGTCLNHYNLLEKKQVGETTNMLDIVTALGLADKVIRP